MTALMGLEFMRQNTAIHTTQLKEAASSFVDGNKDNL